MYDFIRGLDYDSIVATSEKVAWTVAATLDWHFDATKPIYVKAQKRGLGGKDTAAVCAVLEDMAKLKRGKRTA